MAGLLHFRHAMQTTRECSECHQVLPLEDFHRRQADPLGIQNICRTCKPEATNRSLKRRQSEAQRAADTEAREQREIMILLHERGRHENAPNENCPVCRAEAGWMKPNFPPSGSAAAQ